MPKISLEGSAYQWEGKTCMKAHTLMTIQTLLISSDLSLIPDE
jgi:hypothetical protein